MTTVSVQPIIDEDRRHTTWFIKDIYTGVSGNSGRYTPNVDDLVWDYTRGLLRCVSVDFETGLSTLVPWSMTNVVDNTDTTDLVIGGNSTTDDTYRVYVNTDKLPYAFSFDARFKLYGGAASYVKLFKDGDVETAAISAIFNSAGVQTSENIPLEPVVIPNTTVSAIKTPKLGHLTEKVENGDVLNVVVYSSSGAVQGIFRVVCVISNFVRTIDSAKRLITNIELITPYLSASDDRVVEYPANMTVDSSALRARVTYNDGSTQSYAVDGRKFSLFGTEGYLTSIPGQSLPVVLNYVLAEDEYSNLIKEVGNRRFITKEYTLKTVKVDNLYSVKMFVVPEWVSNEARWRLRYYLYNLERDLVTDVTSFIEYGVNSNAFNGSGQMFGVTQSLTVAFNLDKLGGSYSYYRHVQNFNITIHQAGDIKSASSYYTLAYDVDSIVGTVSVASLSVTGTRRRIDISNGYTNIDEWLARAYYGSEPLYYAYAEQKAPKPSHVKLYVGDSFIREITIDSVLTPIDDMPSSVVQGATVRLEFVGNYNSTRSELACIGVIVKDIR